MIAIFPFNKALFDSAEIGKNTQDPMNYLQRFFANSFQQGLQE